LTKWEASFKENVEEYLGNPKILDLKTCVDMIIIVLGLPGSGKSYFASRLARRLNAEYINSDVTRRKMFDIRTYSIKERLRVYNEMLAQMQEAVKQNRDVVLDATFYKHDIRQKFVEGAKDFESIIFIEVRVEESVAKKRLEKERKISEADFEVYEKIKNEWEPLSEDHLILRSTDNNISEMLEKAMNYLHQINDERTNK